MILSQLVERNLEVQGFKCDAPQFGVVEPWLRLNPLICFIIAVLGLYFASAETFFVLAAFGAVGALFPHAMGDIIYNYGIRYVTKTPPFPSNPPPRRFACFVGTMWGLAIAFAFMYGYAFLAYVLGAILLLVIIPMVVWHWCIASLMYQKIIGYRPL